MQRIKILYLIDKLTPAGTQTNLLEIVKRLDRSRFEPKVMALTGGGELLKEFKAAGIEPIELDIGKAYGPSGLRALFFLIRYMKKEKIDVVETHFLHADILGTIAARFSGVQKIITTRRDEGFWRGKRQRSLNRFLVRFADHVVVNSLAVKEAVLRNERVEPSKIHLIYNGADASKYSPSDKLRKAGRNELGVKDNEPVVGMIANMRYEVKGHRYLIDAIPMIKKEIPSVKFILVGDGPLRPSFERYAARLGVSEQIRFLGARRDISALINAMDIVCTPSGSEGFSNSILEAMAVGKPVVASNVGGNPEAVLDGETGLLTRPRSGRAIAEKILFLIQNESFRFQLGKAARGRVQTQFTVEKMAREYEDFYISLGVDTTRHIARPVKMMYLIWSLDIGGAEQVVMDLARKLNRRLFDPIVCCLNGKGRFASCIEQEGIKVFALQKRPKFDPLVVPKLIRLIKKERIDLIHTHLFSANLWGRIAALLTRVPVVSSEHGMDTWRNRFHLTLDALLTPVNKKVIFVSERVKQFYGLRNFSLNGKGRVLYNGIEIEKFEPRSDKQAIRRNLGFRKTEQVIGIVGRLVPEKAHIDFIEGIQLLLEERKDVVGLIIGEGESEILGHLKKRVEDADLQKHIFFLGLRADMAELYQAMDVFVMTSLREGLPLTILEAMAAGVPIVSTDVGGIGECITNGEDGLLVPPGDPLSLAEAISKVLNDRELKERLVRNAKDKVRNRFSVEKMVKNYESLYTEVLSQ